MDELTVYIAPPDLVEQTAAELDLLRPGCVREIHGRLLLAEGAPLASVWAQNIWLQTRLERVESIGQAVRLLKGVQRNWHCHPITAFRRCALIERQLPPVSAKPLHFGQQAPNSALGAWTLLDEQTLIYSPVCSSAFKDGEVVFVEDKLNPPSRAYLKLWELFTLLGEKPQSDELCVELGAAPGGWTWVLSHLGARVFCLDKAPLDPRVAASPLVDFCLGSGFGLEPELVGQADWLFSDMACYPERLLGTIRAWLAASAAKHYVCTIKLQGPTNFEICREFAQIPGSRLLHLSANKHELTWYCRPPGF